jgi:hypothetical protein
VRVLLSVCWLLWSLTISLHVAPLRQIGTYTITCTAEGERLFATKSLEIQQMVSLRVSAQAAEDDRPRMLTLPASSLQHADHVVGLPKAGSWDLLASTEKSLVHALASRYPDGKVHFLAIQGHPEVCWLASAHQAQVALAGPHQVSPFDLTPSLPPLTVASSRRPSSAR